MKTKNYWIAVGMEKRGFLSSVDKKKVNKAIKKVCEVYEVTVEELKSQSRLRRFAEPRKILYYILHRVYRITLEATAKVFNRISHATVIKGIEKVEGFLQVDKYYQEKVSQLGIIKIKS